MMFRRRITRFLAAALITLSLTLAFTTAVKPSQAASYTNAVALDPAPTRPPLTPTTDDPPHVIDGG
jgi:hypothetical protein